VLLSSTAPARASAKITSRYILGLVSAELLLGNTVMYLFRCITRQVRLFCGSLQAHGVRIGGGIDLIMGRVAHSALLSSRKVFAFREPLYLPCVSLFMDAEKCVPLSRVKRPDGKMRKDNVSELRMFKLYGGLFQQWLTETKRF
jgi:hypothetical protein